jgi:3-methylfumaryl-CoA hydratase
MPVDINHLRQWIGRTEEAAETIAPEPLAGLSATLDRDDPQPEAGDEVPPAGHWLYFVARHRQSELGPDGHAERGGFLPPVDLPRRMWAGGRIEFLAPLRVGDQARRVSTIADVSRKEGRSGELVFVLVRHEIIGPDGPVINEEHDIVYRATADPAASPPKPKPAPAEAGWQRTIEPDPVLLFRYSALIFNGHRIHYDHRFTTGEEGYPGLIVHGPLIATLLMELCRRQTGRRLSKFDYRAVSPLFDTAPFTVNGQPDDDGGSAELWAADGDGNLAMTAQAEFAGL